MEEKATQIMKSFLNIKILKEITEKEIEVLEFYMKKLIGEPKVASQSYGKEITIRVSEPIEELYEKIVECQKEINTKKAIYEQIEKTYLDAENLLDHYISTKIDSAEMKIFKDHYILGVPLVNIRVKKVRGKGYLEYRQIKNINKKIREKLENCLAIAL